MHVCMHSYVYVCTKRPSEYKCIIHSSVHYLLATSKVQYNKFITLKCSFYNFYKGVTPIFTWPVLLLITRICKSGRTVLVLMNGKRKTDHME